MEKRYMGGKIIVSSVPVTSCDEAIMCLSPHPLLYVHTKTQKYSTEY